MIWKRDKPLVFSFKCWLTRRNRLLQVLGQQNDLSNVTGKQEGKNFVNAFSACGSVTSRVWALWSLGLPGKEVLGGHQWRDLRLHRGPEWGGHRGALWAVMREQTGCSPGCSASCDWRGLPQRRCSGLLRPFSFGRHPLSDGVTNCDRTRPSSGSRGERRGRWRGSWGRRLCSLETPRLLNMGDARSPFDVETLNWAIFLKYEKEEVLSCLLDVVERMWIFGVKQMGSGFQLWLCILSGSSS